VSLNNKPNGVLRPGRSGFRPAGDGLHPRRCRAQSPLGYNVAHSLFESTGSGAMVHRPVPKIENPGQQGYLPSPNLAVTNFVRWRFRGCSRTVAPGDPEPLGWTSRRVAFLT
jgi:hypothetical protein